MLFSIDCSLGEQCILFLSGRKGLQPTGYMNPYRDENDVHCEKIVI